MIGRLPKQLEVCGVRYDIRTDFRVALTIFEAYDDPELTVRDKTAVLLECLYEKPETIPAENIEEAIKAACLFLDGGTNYGEEKQNTKVLDWVQDEQMIFSAVNKVANKETRELEYLHWWTFLGYFKEIGEGLLTTVVNIRTKKGKGKKLEAHEKEFYKANKGLIDIKNKLTIEEQQAKNNLLRLLDGGESN